MLSSLLLCAALASSVVESRLILPTRLQLQAHQLRREANVDLQEKIDLYYSSGFPKTGRTLQQKIDEADAFLTSEVPKAGAVGVGASIVYEDQVVLVKGYGVRFWNDSSVPVTTDDLFEIGSVSKTFIALGVGLLVDDGKIGWQDPVKKHLPWFKLFDKYAEEHVRIGDLLSMNSGLGRSPDLPLYAGAYDSPRRLVEALEFSEPDHSLRETPAYANTNFEILGQVIEQVSGKPWATFLDERLWKPLGMNDTFASVDGVPAALRESSLNAGHLVCDDNVVARKYDASAKLRISPGYAELACGSVVSSPSDMAKLLRLLLNKGKVGDVTLFKSPSTIAEMTTGKNLAVDEILAGGPEKLQVAGIHFAPEGDTLAAGYGFDMVGDVMWGHAYYEKGGDTYVHHARTSYAPSDRLAVAFQANTQGRASRYLDQVRSYVMGIFFDIPKDILDFEYQKWRAFNPPREAPMPGAPVCGFTFWKNPPRLAVDAGEANALVGEYAATISTTYFPRATVARSSVPNEFTLQFGLLNATIFYVGSINTTKVFMTEGDIPIALTPVTFDPDTDRNGSFLLNLVGIDYRKQ